MHKFGSIRFLYASVYLHFYIVLKRSYRRTSMKRVGIIQEFSCTLESIVKQLQGKERNIIPRIGSPADMTQMQRAGEVGCVLVVDGLKMNVKELLTKNISSHDEFGEFKEDVIETYVYFLRDGVCKFVYLIEDQPQEIMEAVAVMEIILHCMKFWWI